MLKTAASKQESHVAANKLAVRSAAVEPQYSGFPQLSDSIQRKTVCACGGGCPRCSAGPSTQAALPVSQPGDALERDADLKADQVLRKAGPQALAQTPHQVTQLFGSYFHTDFSDVRLNTDEHAAAFAKVLGARAFTVGAEITFARNQFAPHTAEGHRLLAHEFAHVVQQRNAPAQIQRQDDGTGMQTTYIFGGIPDFLNCDRSDLNRDANTPCCSSTTLSLIPGLYDTSREYLGRAITRMESGANMDGAIQNNFGAGALSQRAEILARLRLIQTEL